MMISFVTISCILYFYLPWIGEINIINNQYYTSCPFNYFHLAHLCMQICLIQTPSISVPKSMRNHTSITMSTKLVNCEEKPLGILCRCAEYEKIAEKLLCYYIGADLYLLPKIDIEPIASAKVLWIKNELKVNEDVTKPLLLYHEEKQSWNAENIDKIWMPYITDLIPLKYIKI